MQAMQNEQLAQVAREFGTPSFVFDVGAFQDRLRAVRDVFGESIALCYAIKANPFLVSAAAQVANRLEVCSPGELDICRALGVDPAQIVFSGVNKTAESVRAAVEYGVGVLTAESLKHARLIEEEGARRGVVLDVLARLNAGSQFGMSRDDLLSLIDRRADYPHVRLVGIHYFVGTQRMKLKHQRKELEMLLALVDELRDEHGFRVERLEYGPGLGVPLFEGDDFSDTLAPARELADALRTVAQRVELTVEMGRFFATECGTYLTTVNDVKTNEGVNYCIVDGGINHLTYVGQLMGMKVPVIRNITHAERAAGAGAADAGVAVGSAGVGVAAVNDASVDAGALDNSGVADPGAGADGAPAPGDAPRDWCVCGSLCTTGDVLTRAVQLPSVREGDVLAFGNCGAYAVTEGVALFLSRTMPRVIMRDDHGSFTVARDFTETSPLNTIR